MMHLADGTFCTTLPFGHQVSNWDTPGHEAHSYSGVFTIIYQVGRTEPCVRAIATRPPSSTIRAVFVPQIERRRAGLDKSNGLWVILEDHNLSVFAHSFYIEPITQNYTQGAVCGQV